MLRGIGNFFHSSNNSKQNTSKQDSNNSLISMFSQNLTAFSNIKKGDPIKSVFFLDIISHFQVTFDNFKPEKLLESDINNILINYLKICAEFGNFIFDADDNSIDCFFDSLIFTSYLFDNNLPNADSFFSFFCSLLYNIQENQNFLKKSYLFLLVLFKSSQFYSQFLQNDGLCIVFSSIFLNNDKSFQQTQETFLDLIFKTGPHDTLLQIPFLNVTNFNVFLDMLKPIIDNYEKSISEHNISNQSAENSKEKIQNNSLEKVSSYSKSSKLFLKNACLYVSLYLKSFKSSCPTLISDFNSSNGFSLMNRIFISDSEDDSSTYFYKSLLESTDMNETVLTSLVDLFQNELTKSSIRTSIILSIFMNDNLSINDENSIDQTSKIKIHKLFQSLIKIAPISSYFRRPPFLDRKGLEYSASLIKFFLKQNLDRISMILYPIMIIIGFPEDDQIPADLYYQLLIDEYQIGELKIEMILNNQCNFVQDFVLSPNVKEVTSYYHHNKMAFTILYYVFLSNEAKQYRFSIIQKIVMVLNFIYDKKQKITNKNKMQNQSENEDRKNKEIELELECNQYTDFLFSLLESTFSEETCRLLLFYAHEQPIMKVLTKVLKQRTEYFGLFIKSGGFSFLNNFISKYSSQSDYYSILGLLSSLSHFYHHRQIDEWILNQPTDSPLFQFPRELMAKIAIGFEPHSSSQKPKNDISILHIPSFLPFCDDFDSRLEFNLYLAGRFGVPACLKMGIPITKIPHFSLIANRFITPDLIELTFKEKMLLIPEFLDIQRPHFSLFELIPKPISVSNYKSNSENSPNFLTFEQPFSSFSFWFRIPIISISPIKVYLVSVPQQLLNISIKDEDLVIKTNKDKFKVPKFINENWHNITVSFIRKRNIINSCVIKIDNSTTIDTIELKVEEQSLLPNILVFGNFKKASSIPIQYSKNIVLSENAISQEQLNKIYQKGLFHPTQKNKFTKRSQFTFEAHYLGFPFYFKTKLEIEDVFNFLDELDSIDEFKCIFNVLLNLLILNNINFSYFWHRIIIILKKHKDLVSNELSYFVHVATKSLLEVSLRMNEINIFLSDTEFYFIFDFNSIKTLLESILNDNSIDWNCLESMDLTNSLLSIIRSGIDENIQLLLVPVLNKLLKGNQTTTKLKNFMNSIISMSDFSNSIERFNSMIQFDELIEIQKVQKETSNSEVLNQLLIAFVESAKICFDEVYSLKQLIVLIFIYLDEKATILVDLLAFYSYKNPNYLKKYPQGLLCYVFSQLCDNSKMWKFAFSILSCELINSEKKTKNSVITIKKPEFLPVILGMLESLASKCSYFIIKQKQDEHDKCLTLFSKIVNKLLRIEPSQFYLLYKEKNCDKLLNSLLFLGIIPNSYISDSSDKNLNKNANRSLKILSNFSIDPPSKSEVKDIISLTSPSSLFMPINVPEKFYNEQQTIQSKSMTEFPKDLENCTSLIDFVEKSNLLELFTSILFADSDNTLDDADSSDIILDIDNNDDSNVTRTKSSDFTNSFRYFEKYLLDFLNGTALMYLNYWKEIANKLIFKVLNRIYSNHIPNSINVLKSTFEGIHKCIASGVFSENYLDLMELIFLIFKKGEFTIDQFLSDDKYLEYYRNFLLMVFYFSPLKNKNYKFDLNTKDPIFDILMKNKDFVFTKNIFSDNKFSSLWLHASRLYNQSVSANLRNENSNTEEKIINEKESNEKKSTDPGICCMSFLLAVIDNSVVSSYDPASLDEIWHSYLSKDLFDSQDVESKMNKMNSIIEMKQKIQKKAAKCELISHIYRAVNLSVEQNLVFYKINIRQRQNERMMFLYTQIARKRKLASAPIPSSLSTDDNNTYIHSFHLSPICYPINQSRAITPSPFIIKSPPSSYSNTTQEIPESKHSSKSDYALDYFHCKERIKAIEKCGLLNCSPEWCYFNSIDNAHDEFSSVFEYSQIIEQGPPSTLSLFEDAFSEYFIQSPNSSSSSFSLSLSSLTSLSSLASLASINGLSSLQSVPSAHPSPLKPKKCNYLSFDVSFLYYIHTIPSVLFLTENHLLIVILAKGNLQLISQPENPVAFLPFSENVALGEYNNKVSMFCGHVVIIIKYDHILKMNSHLFIHKNVGLLISSFRSTDIVLIFDSTSEMRQANNFIVTKRLQKEQMKQKQNKQTEIQQLNQQFNTDQQKDHIAKSKSMTNPPAVSAQSTISGFSLSLNLNQNSSFLSLNQSQLFPPCSNLLLFTIDSLSSASLHWKNNNISNFDYLLLLNFFGGRSFLDLSQYPVVPWIVKPDSKEIENSTTNDERKEVEKKDDPNESKNTVDKNDSANENSNNDMNEKKNPEDDNNEINDQEKKPSDLKEPIKDEESNELINDQPAADIQMPKEEDKDKFELILPDLQDENQEEENEFEESTSSQYEEVIDNDDTNKEIEFQMRNLALPMGQLSKKRARHFDQTYELSAPMKYYYGFHYSLPGAVFWLLMRTSPFTFFLWDLNDGWDNSQRLFVSLNDAYNSAASTNPSDLKELVPALYQVPEALTNVSNIKLNVSNDNVILPSWSNDNPFFFTEMHLKLLNSSNNIQKWIDLIFGYKQSGEVATEFKNLFLPSSYHTSCAEDLEMDQESYNSQALNFGQCPIQLFKRAHPFKLMRAISRLPSYETLPSKKRKSDDFGVPSLKYLISIPKGDLTPKKGSTSYRPRVASTPHKVYPCPSTPEPPHSSRNPFSLNQTAIQPLFPIKENQNKQPQKNLPIPSLKGQLFRGSSNLFAWEAKDILNSGELINPLNLRTFMAAPIGKIFIALPKNATFYPLKCSGSTFFFIIDRELESLSFIRMSELMEIVFTYFSSEFAFATNLAVSDDGMFISISFSFGRVDVYRVVFDDSSLEKESQNERNGIFISNFIKNINTNSQHSKSAFLSVGCPKGIVKFGSYSNRIQIGNDPVKSNISCNLSALLPQDFICATAFDDGSVIIWNFAREVRHRVLWPFNDLTSDFSSDTLIINLKEGEFADENAKTKFQANSAKLQKPISLVFDPFDGVLTVAFSFGVIQYSINGKILRKCIIDPSKQTKASDKNSANETDSGKCAENEKELSQLSITCVGILGLDFMFDKRLLLIGLSDGSLRLLSASSSKYSFVDAGTIKAHRSSVSSILCQTQLMRVVTVDSCGIARLFDFSVSLDQTSLVVRCSFCDCPQSTVCKACQMPSCDGCIVNGTGLCRNCFQKQQK